MKRALCLSLIFLSGGLLGNQSCDQDLGGQIPQPVPPVQGTSTLYYGYYGVSAESHLETAGHTNLVMTGAWGDWSSVQGRQDITNTTIRHLKESRALGVHSAMVAIDYLIFTSKWEYRGATGLAELRDFFTQLRNADVLNMIIAIYPVDEPDDRKFSDAFVKQMNADLRAVLQEFPEMKTVKIAVFYTDHGNWPGLSSYDWVGYDSYGAGVVKPPVSGNQRIMLIPGGANPWKETPEKFYQAALKDPRVVLIMPFIWFDGENPGIRSNGMATQYKAVGCKITGRCN